MVERRRRHTRTEWEKLSSQVIGKSTALARLNSVVHRIYTFCRWYNQLCPHLKKESFDEDEDCVIINVWFSTNKPLAAALRATFVSGS